MRGVVPVLAAAMAVGLLAGCTSPDPIPSVTPYVPAPVELSLPDWTGGTITVGVVVPPKEGEGSEYRPLADGAGVAGYRFRLGGAPVQIVTALDDGTSVGADKAVQTLINQHVSGIVMVSPGPHTELALTHAAQTSTPIIGTYAPVSKASGNQWSIAPSDEGINTRIQDALKQAGASKPVLIGSSVRGTKVGAVSLIPMGDNAAIAASVLDSLTKGDLDSVVIDAPAADQANVTIAIQQALGDKQIPIVLTPQAQTPTFGDAMIQSGTGSGWLVSVGPDTGDLASLTQGASADAAAAFYAAIRLAGNDPTCRNMYNDDSCAYSSATAAIASHDAVVSVVRAAVQANSTDPASVQKALATMKLDSSVGLAGPGLDFTSTQALADSSVQVLYATAADPGVRPPTADTNQSGIGLYWFAASS